MCPPWIPWIPCSCGLVFVPPIRAHIVMSSVWSGPSSARVWLIYCLCNLPINVVRNPGRTPVDSTRMSRRPTVDQGVQRQRLSDANASNDNTSRLAPAMNLSGKLRCPIISPYHNYSHPVIPLPVASSRRQQMMLFLSSGRQRLYLNLYNRSTSTNLAALAHCMRGGFQFSFRSSSPINSTVQSMTSRYSRTLTTPVC